MIVVVSIARPLEGMRVALICSDRNEHAALVEQLAAFGAVGVPRAILGDLAAVAEMCAAVVVFADGYEASAVGPRLDGIERWRDGPTLIVVTDCTPSPWIPKLERDRPAVVVARSEWATKLLTLAAPPTEPELPFTD
jgi:hypothetical protein